MNRNNREVPCDLPLSSEQLDQIAGGTGMGELRPTTPTANTGHDQWIDLLSVDWGQHKPGGGATGR